MQWFSFSGLIPGPLFFGQMRWATKEEDIIKLFSVLLSLTLKIILDSLIYQILLNFQDLFFCHYMVFYALVFLDERIVFYYFGRFYWTKRNKKLLSRERLMVELKPSALICQQWSRRAHNTFRYVIFFIVLCCWREVLKHLFYNEETLTSAQPSRAIFQKLC